VERRRVPLGQVEFRSYAFSQFKVLDAVDGMRRQRAAEFERHVDPAFSSSFWRRVRAA
jgi:hypothetical protein